MLHVQNVLSVSSRRISACLLRPEVDPRLEEGMWEAAVCSCADSWTEGPGWLSLVNAPQIPELDQHHRNVPTAVGVADHYPQFYCWCWALAKEIQPLMGFRETKPGSGSPKSLSSPLL